MKLQTRGRKGQTIPLIVIVTIAFVGTGHIFSEVFNQETVRAQLDVTTEDPGVIAKGKVSKDIYEDRIEHDLLYATNNAAYSLGSSGGGVDWHNNIPSFDSIQESYNKEIIDRINSRNNVVGCSSPNILGVNIVERNNFKMDFEERTIGCRGLSSHITVNFDPISVENEKNRYLDIGEYSIVLAESARDSSTNSIDESGSASGSCGESSSSVRSDARSSAESSAARVVNRQAGSAIPMSSGSRPSDLHVSEQMGYSGSNHGTSRTSSSSCCEETNDEGECTSTSRRYSYESNYRVSDLEFNFVVTDNGNHIVSYDGIESIAFDFTYVKDLTG